MESPRSLWIRIPLTCLGLGCVAVAITIVVELAQSSNDCDQPIRNYLFAYSVGLCALGLPMALVEGVLYKCLASTVGLFLYLVYLAVAVSALVVMQTFALFLLTKDEECGQQYEEGYELSLGTAGVFFFAIGCLCVGFIFWALRVILRERKGYESLNNETS